MCKEEANGPNPKFVDNNIIREKFVIFLGFKNGLTGVGLYQTINEFLGSVGLDILDCRGERYVLVLLHVKIKGYSHKFVE